MSKKKEIQIINPATEEKLSSFKLMTWKETKAAIKKCDKAFQSWKTKSLEDRAKTIKSIAEKLTENKEELAQLMTDEMGKLLKHSKQEVDTAVGICKWTAENGPKELKNEERKLAEGGKGVIAYCPIGVIYGIQPWNYPLYQVIRYSIANLMAGNGVLLKHAGNVTGCGLKIAEIFESAGLPKNLFTVLLVSHEASNKVIKHDLVRGVTLTGSPKAGKEIGKIAGSKLKKTVLELGANDAYMVLDDADIQNAVKICVMGRTYNNGETCIAAKRFIVTEKNYEEFKEGFVAKMKSLKVGDPNEKDTRIGPMAREDLAEDLHKQVKKSVKKGAKILCGGNKMEGKGFYFETTVLENVKPGQPAYDDELFGPVASLIKAKDDEDAMRIANDSRFGLGGGIISADEEKAFKLAENHFDTGMVFINCFGLAQPNMPFGGVKNSGYGREHGGFGMKEFTNAKAIMSLNQ